MIKGGISPTEKLVLSTPYINTFPFLLLPHLFLLSLFFVLSFYLEEIITGHAWLARDTGRDHDSMSSSQGLGQRVFSNMSCYFRGSVDVGEIGGDSGRIDDIVQGQV